MVLSVHIDSSSRPLSLVLERQLVAVDAFTADRRRVLAPCPPGPREQRLDAERHRGAMQARHAALVARLDAVWRAVDGPMTFYRPSALVAHRHPWFAGRMAALLAAQGMRVVGVTASGTEAVGWAVAELPDVVVVGDTLEAVPGEQVVRELRRYCPAALVVAQVGAADQVAPMLDAGAGSVHLRTVPPADIAEAVVRVISGLPVSADGRQVPAAT